MLDSDTFQKECFSEHNVKSDALKTYNLTV